MSTPHSAPPLTVMISGRALFDTEASHRVFMEHGVAAFIDHERRHADHPLPPGPAMHLIGKLLRLPEEMVRIVLISRNSASTAPRLIRSLAHHGLDRLHTAIFTSGGATAAYARAMDAGLFLSANGDQVVEALAAGIPSAVVARPDPVVRPDRAADVLRIAFDGDAVLFDDEAERVCQENGLAAFHEHETSKADQPMPPGPMLGLLRFCNRVQEAYATDPDRCPIRVALVTARSIQVQQRVATSFEAMGVRVDEMAFLGGAPKGPILKAWGADIFFDDSIKHVASSLENGVTACHVPYGISNTTRPLPTQEARTSSPATPEPIMTDTLADRHPQTPVAVSSGKTVRSATHRR